MNKAYTTAQMLDGLKMGQQAKMVEPQLDIIVQRTEGGLVGVKDGVSTKHIGLPIPLSATVMSAKWEIVEKELTMNESLDCIKANKTVICRIDGKTLTFDHLNNLVTFHELINGKWFLWEG